VIFFLSILVAFLGYVLPMGKMSFWGATVIFKLLRVIPKWGKNLVILLLGGDGVNKFTIPRLFCLHYLLPFIIFGIVGLHIFFLHSKGSRKSLTKKSKKAMIPFFPYFGIRDLIRIVLTILVFFFLILIFPYLFFDSKKFIISNSVVTPLHIQPE
jgi:ubiquinol-cytochrome c reductase cytochrome b subunit